MSFKDKVKKSNASRDGNYVREGSFIARIDLIAEGVTNNTNRAFLKAELSVLKVLGPAAGSERPAHIEPTAPLVERESLTYMVMQDQKSSAANVKAMLLMLAGVSENDITDEQFDDIYNMAVNEDNATFIAATGEAKGQKFDRNQNALAGTVVQINARDIIKKESKKKEHSKLTRADDLFTKVSFIRVLPPSEFAPLLDEKTKALLYPGDTLETLLAEEAAG